MDRACEQGVYKTNTGELSIVITVPNNRWV
jgi:hypothetical protein